MNIKLELPQLMDLKPRLTVIGIGGAGCNAVNNMIAAGLTGVEFVVANTDAQTLEASSAEHRVQLGTNLTEGLGAGANPEIGAAAAEEAIDEIKSQISGSHMVFLAAGMGGGTGTGAISVIARASRDMGILTVGVVTKPFQFEGSRRLRMAEAGIKDLRQHVDTLIVIPNQNLFRVANEKTTFAEAFLLADQVLYSGVACIVDLIVREGLINLDFADVRAVMRNMGTAMMGTGEGVGERRAIMAAEEAIANPLLDDVSLQGAKGLLLSITGGPDLTLSEVDEAASRVRKEVDPEANIIVGATFDDTMEDRVRVSIVASGMVSREMGANPGYNAAAPGAPGGVAAPGSLAGFDPRSPAERPANSAPPPMPPPVPAGLENAYPAPTKPSSDGVANLPEPDPSRSAAAQGKPQPPPPLPAGERAGAPPPKASAVLENNSALWRSTEGVTIEAGPDSFNPRPTRAAQQPPPADRARAPEASTFQPRQTEEIHRRTRRMPEVEDFPAVGQRDYYAKSAPATQERDPGQPEPGRKQGLFSRLTGMTRRTSDSQPAPDTSRNRAPPQSQRPADPRADDGRERAARERRNDRDEPQQDVELPVFFTNDQGRR